MGDGMGNAIANEWQRFTRGGMNSISSTRWLFQHILPSRLELVQALALSGIVAGLVAISQPPAAYAAQPADIKVAPLKLTPEEQAERNGRKACKIQICAAFRLRKPGDDIACNIVKTWRKSQLNKYMSKVRVSWPWGKMQCTSSIKIPRQMILDAMTKPTFDLQLDEHKVACTVAREKGSAKISFSFRPKVRFEKGKAAKASLNWGKVNAPTLVKGVMWTVKTTDNTFNVLQSSIVEDINEFVSTRCDEIKADWEK